MGAGVCHPDREARAATQPFLVADVGGTHARVALVRATDTAAIELLACRKFECAAHADLIDLLRAFVDAHAGVPVRRCVLACAGQVVDDVVVHDNLAWPINPARLREALGLDDVAVLNDFEALAHMLDDPDGLDGQLLCGPDTRGPGPRLVVGPGTGLGAAMYLAGPARGIVLTTEAGQMDFAPQTRIERELLSQLAPDGGYVPYERVVSGPGLLTLYRTLCRMHGQPARLTTPAAITAAARAQTDREALQAVEVFCAVLGGFAGNLAMVFMAAGGVYLAGGFLSSMFDLLRQSRFAERFMHERSVREFLVRVPVRVIEHGRLGLLGAAKWQLARWASERATHDDATGCKVA